jgi:ribonuclease HI
VPHTRHFVNIDRALSLQQAEIWCRSRCQPQPKRRANAKKSKGVQKRRNRQRKDAAPTRCTVFASADGSASPNPGEAAYGYVGYAGQTAPDLTAKPLFKGYGRYTGNGGPSGTTNNEAEYVSIIHAFVSAVFEVQQRPPGTTDINLQMDSDLVYHQNWVGTHAKTGKPIKKYKVKKAHLKPLAAHMQTIISAAAALPGCTVKVKWVRRTENTEAHEFAAAGQELEEDETRNYFALSIID